ncbi:unannotated protein [freshwater metagenome]|uniref:Unannotated protein n=1 Tax=freshwater metagenome TaxID=449393 RepID=A0A6J7AS68_9ZZZZ
MVPSSISRSCTFGVSGSTSAAWSDLYFEVKNTLAAESLRMYASSLLVSRLEQFVYTAPA